MTDIFKDGIVRVKEETDLYTISEVFLSTEELEKIYQAFKARIAEESVMNLFPDERVKNNG